jgi:hypothetical protein
MPDRHEEAKRSPQEQVRALYEDAESRAAQAFEEAVSKPSFGTLLAHSAENIAALTRISADVADLVLRNLRIAGRADITRLARQLHRTEDKLERVLQEVEQLRDELGSSSEGGSNGSAASRSARSSHGAGRGSAGNGGNGGNSRASRGAAGSRRRKAPTAAKNPSDRAKS